MAQVDVGIHRIEDFRVKAENSNASFWVELTPKEDQGGTLGCLTFYVGSAEQARALVTALTKCGAEWKGGAQWLGPVPDDAPSNAAEEFAHGTSERR